MKFSEFDFQFILLFLAGVHSWREVSSVDPSKAFCGSFLLYKSEISEKWGLNFFLLTNVNTKNSNFFLNLGEIYIVYINHNLNCFSTWIKSQS